MRFYTLGKKMGVKAIVLIVLVSLVAPPALLFPKTAQALIPVNDPVHTAVSTFELAAIDLATIGELGETIWKYAQEYVIAALKKRLLDMLVDQIVDYIQGGGKPKFVSNWKGFLDDATDQAVGDIISGPLGKQLGIDFLCKPFNIQLKVSLGGGGQRANLNGPAACTLDQITGNIESFYNDFKTGGFIAYSASWDPNNNLIGSYLTSQSAAINEKVKKTHANELEATSGGGYLSSKQCDEDGGTGTDIDGDKKTGDIESTCKVVTPGNTIGNLTSKAIGTDLDFIANANTLGDYASAISNALITRVTNEANGGLSNVSTRRSRKNGNSAGTDWNNIGEDPCEGLNEQSLGDAFIQEEYDLCLEYQDNTLGSLEGGKTLLLQKVQGAVNLRASAQQLIAPVRTAVRKIANRLDKPAKRTDFGACLLNRDFNEEYGTREEELAYFQDVTDQLDDIMENNQTILNGDHDLDDGSPLQYGLKTFMRDIKNIITRPDLDDAKQLYETTPEFTAESAGAFKQQIDAETDLYNDASPSGGLVKPICLEKDANGVCVKEPRGGLMYTISRLNDFLDKPCGPDKDSIDEDEEEPEGTPTP